MYISMLLMIIFKTFGILAVSLLKRKVVVHLNFSLWLDLVYFLVFFFFHLFKYFSLFALETKHFLDIRKDIVLWLALFIKLHCCFQQDNKTAVWTNGWSGA